jgi:hypothetical protein
MNDVAITDRAPLQAPANTDENILNQSYFNFKEPLSQQANNIRELESLSQQALKDFEDLVVQMSITSEKRLLELYTPSLPSESSYYQPDEARSIQIHTGFLSGAPTIELSYLPGKATGFFCKGEDAQLKANHVSELRTSPFLNLTISDASEIAKTFNAESLAELLQDTIVWIRDIVDYVVKEGKVRAQVNVVADFNELFELQLVRSVANILDLPGLEAAYFETYNHNQRIEQSQLLIEPLRKTAQEVQAKLEEIKLQISHLQQELLSGDSKTLAGLFQEQLMKEYHDKLEQLDQEVNQHVQDKYNKLVAEVSELETKKESALREAKSKTLKFDFFAMIDAKIPDYQFDSVDYYSTQRLTKADKAVWANQIAKAMLESSTDISPKDAKVIFEKLLKSAAITTNPTDLHISIIHRSNVEKIIKLTIYILDKTNQDLLPTLLTTLDGFSSAKLDIDVLTRTLNEFLKKS